MHNMLAAGGGLCYNRVRTLREAGRRQMTLEQIRYFVASVEAGSFSAAAKQMYVSHSSVSRGVQALEQELGVVLLVRGRRELRCTPAGESFLRQSQELLRQTVRMKDSMARYRTRQRLQIVSIGAYMPRFYELLRRFREQYPAVDLGMEQVDQRAAVEKLRSGEADLSVSFSYSWPQDETLDALVVERGRFCALAPQNHPFAARKTISREELADCPDLLGENPFGLERRRDAGDPQDLQSIIMQIKAGNGVTVLPEHAAAEFGHGCAQIAIHGTVNEYQLLLGWRRENASEARKAAVAFFRSHLP